MADRTHRRWEGVWNEQNAPLFDALNAAMEAGPLIAPRVRVRLQWPDKDTEYDSLDEAAKRLRHSPLAEVDVTLSMWDEDDTPARLRLEVDKQWTGQYAMLLRASGTDWARTERAFEAAVKALDERATAKRPEPEPTPEPVIPTEPEPLPQPEPPRAKRTWGQWANENQGVVALIGLGVAVLAIVVAVLIA